MTVWVSDRSDTIWVEIEKTKCSCVPLSAIPFCEEESWNSSLERRTMNTLLARREVQRNWRRCPVRHVILKELYNVYFIHQLLAGNTLKTDGTRVWFTRSRLSPISSIKKLSFQAPKFKSNSKPKQLSPIEQYFFKKKSP